MKSFAVFAAAVAALLVAGCATSPSGSDAMMSGKKKEGSCPFQAAAKKDSCCDSQTAVKDKKASCCDSVATKDKQDSCCESGAEVKVKSGCCEGKNVSVACDDCKKACESKKPCDKPSEVTPKP